MSSAHTTDAGETWTGAENNGELCVVSRRPASPSVSCAIHHGVEHSAEEQWCARPTHRIGQLRSADAMTGGDGHNYRCGMDSRGRSGGVVQHAHRARSFVTARMPRRVPAMYSPCRALRRGVDIATCAGQLGWNNCRCFLAEQCFKIFVAGSSSTRSLHAWGVPIDWEVPCAVSGRESGVWIT